MSSHNGDIFVCRIRALVLRDKAACAHHIEGCDTEKTLGVVDSFRFEDFGTDWHGTVDRVGNDENIGVWCGICDGFGEVPDDGGVGVEKVCERSLLEDVPDVGGKICVEN